MRALIYGGGSVGLGLAGFLTSAGWRATILARPATARALRAEGLRRSGVLGDFSAPPDSFQVLDSLAPSSGPSAAAAPRASDFDHILVCVKAFDTEEAAANLAAFLGPDSLAIITIFQNGWGGHEIFARHFPPARVYSARVITGFSRPEPNHVHISVHGDDARVGSLFGAPLAPIEPLCGAIARGGYPCSPAADVARHLWAKMLYNCALNPLGAICGVSYGDLAGDPHSRAVMDAVMDEVFAAMRAAGHETLWPTADEYRRAFYERLVPPTAAHFSSTAQDLRAGRRTEIDAFCGAVVALAARAGLAAPVNETLLHTVKFMESRNPAQRA